MALGEHIKVGESVLFTLIYVLHDQDRFPSYQFSTMGWPRLYHSPEEKALAVHASKENYYLKYTYI